MRIVANLEVESTWQRLLLPHRPTPQLGVRAIGLISAYGTLLRAFANPGEGDELWTPSPVDPSRLTPLLPVPKLISGDDARPASVPASAGVAWGQVADSAARVNHRKFAFDLARQLGVCLPGSSWVEDFDELLETVGSLDRWVAKAPLSAAGRERVLSAGPLDDATTRRLRNLLGRADGLLVEPWKERVDDFGTLLDVGDEGTSVVSLHRQVTRETGAFVGIDWPLEEHELTDPLRATALAVGEALRLEGYRGPACVDAWTWGQKHGTVALNPLGEINARLSFGWVARQIGLRLGHEQVRLRLGSGREMVAAIGRGGEVKPLLLPDPRGVGAAWLEGKNETAESGRVESPDR